MPEYSESRLLEDLVAVSRHYGADPHFVLAGGGNTSAKNGERLFVKGSGHALATITADGFVAMHRPALEALLNAQLSTDRTAREEQFKSAVMAARVDPARGQRPSVEVVLHHLMPGRFVVHTHSTVVNMFTCCKGGRALVERLCGDEIVWIDSVDPGFVLVQALRKGLADFQRRTGRPCPRAVIMGNHGLVVCGATIEEVRAHTDWLIGRLAAWLDQQPAGEVFGPVQRIEESRARPLINLLGPALRGLSSTDENLKIVTFDDSPLVMALVGGAAGKAAATGGAMTPDQLVYCRTFPLWFECPADEPADATLHRLRKEIAAHTQKTRFAPLVVLVPGLGLFAIGDDAAGAQTVKVVYQDAIKVMAGASRLGGIQYLDPDLRRFLEDWEVESYRRNIAQGNRRAGRVLGKVAVVTGAAQGFGLEIAQDLAAQGAHVVLTDMNIAGANCAAEALRTQYGADRALALPINVTDGESVATAFHQVVRTYGGFDLLVSNAGVLKAGSVKTQPQKEFEFVTDVNYIGYFVCVQNAAPILAAQHQARPEVWSDIIQINSKSGLQGSNKNGAYAGSKFGGIGLTQSFALELVEDGIKVNAICPGNFFDGPLWSDPNHGLFVQYLRSGKVPGATTIADVKRFYESKVPMGRGCTTRRRDEGDLLLDRPEI